MRIPEDVRSGLREKLWVVADALDWSRLCWQEKASWYEAWTRDSEVGGVLAQYMDGRKIRVYIKDTIMKGYVRDRLADPLPIMGVLGLRGDSAAQCIMEVAQEYERPHGRRLVDGRVFVWSKAKDWKAVLMVTHERAFEAPGCRPFAAVLLGANGRFAEPNFRAMVEDAARKLGIERLEWLG